MPVTNWSTTFINGREFLVIDVAQFRIPMDWDPNSNMFLAVAAPDGGVGGFSALARGDDGQTPIIDSQINLTPLPWNDPSPDYASWDQIAPNTYQLSMAIHQGSPGDPSAFNLEDAENLVGVPLPGNMIVVDEDGVGYAYATPKVGDMYWPASIANTPSGNPSYTLCAVGVPAQPWDWRPHCEGWAVVDPTGIGVSIDLVARLNDPAAGNIVGRGRGNATGFDAGDRTINLAAGVPAGSAADYNKILAGEAATIYLRAERQSGIFTFTTTAADTWFSVTVKPIP